MRRRFEAFIVRFAAVLCATLCAAFASPAYALPNLVSFQPDGWSDKLVVSSQKGTQTDSSPLTESQTLYVSWAVINNGDASASVAFTTELYLDGTLQAFWTSDPPLDATFYLYVKDYALGPLGQGTHTLMLKTDTTNAINESNEQDNIYTKMITIIAGGLPNLVEFQPNGWSDKLVVSVQRGTQADSNPLTDSQMLYVSWAVLNNGDTSTAATFTTQLYVDGTLQTFWTTDPPLDPAFYTSIADYALGPLSAGTHTLTLKTDTTNAIVESNEQDNTYTKMVTVTSGGLPNLTPFQPNGWSDKLVVSTQQGTQTDSSPLTDAQTLYVSWAVINDGDTATAAAFTTQLYVDGALQFSWTQSPSLAPTYYVFVDDNPLGPLGAGTHTLTLKTDTTNAINESNEQDNVYTKMVTVSGGTPGTSTPTTPPAAATATASRPPVTGTPGMCGCVGDCNCDGRVTVDELLMMVNIALGNADVSACAAGDPNNDKQVTVDEILMAVNNALNGCALPPTTLTPAAGTATPTPTPTATVAGGGSIPRRAAGASVELVQGLRAIPAVISAFTQLAGGGSSTAALVTDATATSKSCNGGGSRSLDCTQTVPSVSPRNYTLSFSPFCTLNTAGGGTVTLQASTPITAQSTETGFLAICSLPPLALSTATVTGLQITAKNSALVNTLTATVDLMGSISITPDLNPSNKCHISALDMKISTGNVTAQSGSVNLSETFSNTDIAVTVSQFSPDCVPVKYTMTLNGAATFSGASVGGTLAAVFTSFVFTNDSTSGDDSVTLNGKLNSTCLGTEVTLNMPPPQGLDAALMVQAGAVCPSAGSLRATQMGTTDRVTYTAAGGVQIDLGNNGGAPDESYTSCLNSSLYMCPAGS